MTEPTAVTGTLTHLAHWGAFDVAVDGDDVVGVAPHGDDPAPYPLIDNVLDAARGPNRVRRPAVRRGWLEDGPGARPPPGGR